MGISPWITCCWPGLPRLWWRGEWSGLVTAVFFAIWLNSALATTYFLPEMFPNWGVVANWAVLSVFWLICVRAAVGRLSQIYCGEKRYNDDLFSRAQEEYLRGQWFEAESLLLRLVRDDPADVEGRLLLSTLYRHTQRADLARTQLDQLERYPHAGRWRWEVLQERAMLRRLTETGAVGQANLPEAPVAIRETDAKLNAAPDGAANELDRAAPVTQEGQSVINGNSSAGGGLSKAA